jgi:hypothetical protein
LVSFADEISKKQRECVSGLEERLGDFVGKTIVLLFWGVGTE